jgi:RNA polymerase sigma factor (sigma-70 family)
MALRESDASMTTRSADARGQFAAFYADEFPGQVRRARFILGASGAAEDVVHQAFVEVWGRWDSLRDPGPYLNRCVVNGARSQHQRHARRSLLVERMLQAAPPLSPEIEILDDVLSELPFNHRAAIVLRYYGGLRDAEIAAAMQCPTGSVGPWIHRGLEQLREALS